MSTNRIKISSYFFISCIIITVFFSLLYVSSALNRSLHYQDELRYAEVAKEMYATGKLWIPRFGGLPYTQKPPMYFWILNMSRMVFNSYSTFAMVLPAIFAAIILILLIFKFTAGFINLKYALLSGAIMATTVVFYGLAIYVRMDMLMVLFITCSLISFYRGYHAPDAKIKNKCYLWIYLFTAAAVFVKGPYGLLTPLIVIPSFLIINKDFQELKKLKLLSGFGLLAGLFLIWVALVLKDGGKDYAYQLFVVQTLGRAKDSFDHAQPFYYYIMFFPVVFLPWTFFLISYFVSIIKYPRFPEIIKFLLIWFLAPLILFSCFSCKLATYLLPVIPPAAILVGYLISEILEKRLNNQYFVIPAIFTLLITIGMTLALGKVDGISNNLFFRIISITIFIMGIVCLISLWKKQFLVGAVLLITSIYCFLLNFSLVGIPCLSQSYSRAPIAYKLKSLKNKGFENIISYKYGEVNSLAVYTNFFIDNFNEKAELVKYIEVHDRTILLIKQADWDKVKESIPGRARMIFKNKDNLTGSKKTAFQIVDIIE